MQAVIVSFDSLCAYSLGCYGNDWIETPHCDRLAASGVVFDYHFTESIGQDAAMAWVDGQCAQSRSTSASPLSLGRRLKSHGVATKIIAANQSSMWYRSAEFDEAIIVEGTEGADVEPHEVPIAHLIKAGIEAWNSRFPQSGPRLLWLHAPAPGVPPHGFESLYYEDFEERGQRIAELSDEDRAEHPALYAGTVSLIDHWLGELLTAIDSVETSEPVLLIVTAAKGDLWKKIVATESSKSAERSSSFLSDQCIRTPLLLRVTGEERFREFCSIRSDRLVQTCDLVPTLLDWFQIPQTASDESIVGRSLLRELTEVLAPRELVCIRGDENLDAVRTANWLSIRKRSEGSIVDPPHASDTWLFDKPEDIWDVNNLAVQQPEVVSELWSRIPAP